MQSRLNQEWATTYKKVEPSLAQERKQLDFNQEQLSELIWNGKDGLENHRRISKIHADDPQLRNNHHFYDMTREEKMQFGFKKLARLAELFPE